MKISETCSCGATISVVDDGEVLRDAKRVAAKWRLEHRHIEPVEPVVLPDLPYCIHSVGGVSVHHSPPCSRHSVVDGGSHETTIADEAADDNEADCTCDVSCGSYFPDCPIHGHLAQNWARP